MSMRAADIRQNVTQSRGLTGACIGIRAQCCHLPAMSLSSTLSDNYWSTPIPESARCRKVWKLWTNFKKDRDSWFLSHSLIRDLLWMWEGLLYTSTTERLTWWISSIRISVSAQFGFKHCLTVKRSSQNALLLAVVAIRHDSAVQCSECLSRSTQQQTQHEWHVICVHFSVVNITYTSTSFSTAVTWLSTVQQSLPLTNWITFIHHKAGR